jgi:hypothetical protein
METVVIDSHKIDVYPLKKEQIRELEDYGFSFFFCRPPLENAHGAMDAAFELALSESDRDFLEGRPVKDSITVWKALLAETYGGGEDEKNLNGTSPGGSTENESNTAGAAGAEKQI